MCHHTKFCSLSNLAFGHPCTNGIQLLFTSPQNSPFQVHISVTSFSSLSVHVGPLASSLSFTLIPCFPSNPQNVSMFINSLLFILLLITIFPTLLSMHPFKLQISITALPLIPITVPVLWAPFCFVSLYSHSNFIGLVSAPIPAQLLCSQPFHPP